MFNNKFIAILLAIFIASTFTACGGGGGIDGTAVTKTDVTSSGTISGFGSVIINGVRYETENASIISEDDDSVVLRLAADLESKEEGEPNGTSLSLSY